MSWFLLHWHVPTNLPCVYYIFVWWCDPSSIGSKYDPLKLGTFMEHIVTCGSWIQDHDGKRIAPQPWAICTTIWWKMWLTNAFHRYFMVWVFTLIILTVRTCMLIKHHMIINKHNMFSWNTTCWHQIFKVWNMTFTKYAQDGA
jgi:hypothetical protein